MRSFLLLLIPVFLNATPMVDHFADNGWGNAIAVVQHPAGEHLDGITYVTYQGLEEDPYVASYNHNTQEWKGPYRAGVSELGKNPDRRKKIDNHGKPAMIIDNDGYIHIVFGGHGGLPKHGKNPLGNHHDGRMQHVVSKRPLDISEWESLDNIPPFGTYNQFVKMDNGDIYLIYRHGAHRSDWVYQKSTDNGRNFDAPVSFLKHKRRHDLLAVDSWYAWAAKGQEDDIIVSFDYHICWDMESGRNSMGHTAERHDLFYMVMDTKDGTWTNIHGEPLSIPLEREEAEQKTLVVRTGDDWTFQGSNTLDTDGNPHVLFYAGKYYSGKFSGPKHTQHFRWDGSKWVGEIGQKLPIGDGDFIAQPSNNEINLILSHRDDETGCGVVSEWNSTDNGKTFTKGKELLRLKDVNFATSSTIRNAHPDARILASGKVKHTAKRKMYLLGEHGPVQRKK